MNAIEISHLSKTYKHVKAVDDLNLSIPEKTLCALLGVNGAGKTTTIRMLCGLTQPDEGDAFLNGLSICQDIKKIHSLIGVSPQESAVASNLNVRENLELIAGAHGFSKDKTKQRVHELMEDFHLHEVAKRKAGKLSGGWQRRLSIAMALVSHPQILFLDEPTLGLDVLARSELWDIIRKLKKQITIVMTTHYMEEAQSLSDSIAIMKKGRLLCTGSVEDIMKTAGRDQFEEAFIQLVKEDV